MPESTRRQIGKYRIQAELGRGGFGVVYSAYDPTVGRPVAVKVLTAIGDNQLLTRFKNEAAAAGNLRHKNIVTIYDYGDDEGLPYIVMELLEGEDLNQIIAARRPMPLLQKVSIMIQVADGLRSAHRAGVVHRDVKPGNIRLLPDGTVKLMDFGIARLVAGSAATRLTRQGHVIGTLYYMAPEQVLGEEVDALSDIFAYGSTYYELLTGKHPFQGLDPRSVFHKITAEDPEPIRNLVPDCPEALEKIVNRTLQKDRDLRYQSLRDVQVDTEPILIELRQERAESLVSEAKRLYDTADLQNAETVLGEVFDLDPANREARQLRETIQNQLLDRLIRPKVEAFVKKADEALSSRRFEDAIESFEAALRLDRDNHTVSQRLEQARELLTLRREMGLLIADARRHFSKQDLEGSLEALLQVIERDPQNPEAQQLLDEVRTSLRRREKERQYQEKLQHARELLQANSFDESTRLLDELDPEFKDSEEVKDLVAQIRSGKEHFERQQQLKQEIHAVRELLGGAQFDLAIKRVEALMNRFPEEVEPTRLFILAHKELAAHRKNQALEKLENELNLLAASGHFERALSLISRSLNTYPSEPRLLEAQRRMNDEWARYRREAAIRQLLEDSERYSAQNQLEKAVQGLETALQQYPDDSRILHSLASARDALASKRRQEGIVNLLSQAQARLNRREYQQTLDLIDHGLAEYGSDERFIRTREKVVKAKAEWERAEEIRGILEKSRQLVAQGNLEPALELLGSGLGRFPNEPELSKALASTRETLKAKLREEGIVRLCTQAQAQLNERKFQFALESIDRGLAEYGRDRRLIGLRDRIALAKAEWDRAEAVRQILEEAQNLVAQRDFNKAISLVESSLRRYPGELLLIEALKSARNGLEAKRRDDAIDALCGQVQTQAEKRDFATALKTVSKGLEDYGSDGRLKAMREAVLSAKADWERSEAIRRAVEVSQQYVERGQPERALESLEAIVGQYGDEPKLQVARAVAREALLVKQREQAIEELRGQAQAQLEAGAYQKAIELLDRGIEDYDGDRRLADLRSTVVSAKVAWERAAAITRIVEDSQKLLVEKEFEKAVTLLESALNEYPAEPQIAQALQVARQEIAAKRRAEAINALCGEAQLQIERHDFARALKVLDQGENDYRSDGQLARMREKVLAAKVDWERAEAVRQAVEKAQGSVAQEDFNSAILLLEASLKRYPGESSLLEALRSARSALEAKRRDNAISALCREAQTQADQRDFAGALKTLSKGLDDYGSDPRLVVGREAVLSAKADWERSEAIRRAVESSKRCLAQGQPESALDLLEAALGQYAGDPKLLEARDIAGGALVSKQREESIEALRRQVHAELEAGAYEDAIALVDRGLKDYSGDRRLAELKVRVVSARTEWERRRAIARIVEDSRKLVAQREFENAISLLESALNEYPGEADIAEAMHAAREGLAAKQRAEAIEACCGQAQLELEELNFENALNTVNQGEKDHGNDVRLAAMREKVLAAKADWERDEAVRQVVQEAQNAVALQDFNKAISLLESSLKRYPAQVPLTQALVSARNAFDAKRRDDAIESLCDNARALIDKQDFLRALKFIDQGEKDHGKDARLSAMRDRVLGSKTDWERAEAIRRAVENANTRLSQQKPGFAVELLEAALRHYPDDPQLREALDVARKAFDAVRREQAIETLVGQVQRNLQAREYGLALDALDRGLKEYEADTRLSDLHEKVLSAKSDWERAQALLQLVTEARQQITAGQPESALETLSSAHSRFGDDPQLREATAAARDAIEAKQREHAIKTACQLAQARLDERQYGPALEIIDAALNAARKDPRLAAIRDKILKAKGAWERSQAIRPVLEESRKRLSENDAQGAMDLLNGALKTYPGAPELLKALAEAREALQGAQKEIAIKALTQETRVFIGAQDFPTALAMVDQGLKTYGPETRLADLRETILVAQADWERMDALRQAVEEANDQIAQGAPDKASSLLEKALSRFPGESVLLDALVSARDAVELKRREETIDRICTDARRQLERGKFDSALQQVARGLKENPNEPRLQELHESISSTKAEAQRAAEIEFALQSAKSLSEQGQREEAIALLEQALNEHPANPQLVGAIVETIDAVGAAGTVALDKICRSARQHMLTGDFDLAFHTIEQALRLHGDEQQAEIASKTRGETAKSAGAGSSSHREAAHISSVKEVTDEQALPGAINETSSEIPITDEYGKESTAVFHPGFAGEVSGPPSVGFPIKSRSFKRWWLLASAAVLLLVSIVAIWMARTPKLGVLRIQSSPTGATVSVNEQKCSTATCEFRLKPGRYRVQVSAAGYQERTEMVTLRGGGAQLALAITLEPLSPTVRVSTNFADGDVVLDNGTAGRMQDGQFTIDRLSPGPHNLRISSREGSASVSFDAQYAKLPAFTNISQQNTDAIASGIFGDRAILTCPGCTGAVSMDERQIGELKDGAITIENVSPGTHRVKVGEGRTLVFSTGKAPGINLVVNSNRNFGTLVIQANEDNATVSIDGKKYARLTSSRELSIQAEAKQHTIRVAKEGYKVDPPEIHAQLKKGDQFQARFNLVAQPARLIISRQLPGSAVWIDGSLTGAVKPDGSFSAQLAPGTHRIEFRKDGYSSATVLRAFEPGRQVVVSRADAPLARVVAPPPVVAAPPKPDPNAAEQADWQRIQGAQSTAQLENFLKNHPAGIHRNEAQARLKELQLQQAAAGRELAWDATDKDSRVALQQFLTQYGDGSHAQDARAMIIAIDKQRQDALTAAQQAKQQAATSAADSTAVLNALKDFETAYNQKSLASIQGVWTGMPKSVAETYRNQFRDAKSLDFRLTPSAQPKVDGNTASVDCTRSLRFVAKNGQRPPETNDRVRVALARSGSQWTIRSITLF